MKYLTWIASIKQQHTVHNWVKEDIEKLDSHDVVDVLRGLELMRSVFQMKLNELTARQ